MLQTLGALALVATALYALYKGWISAPKVR
jgi:hypothetical protein